jgi:hypothetical protein
VKASERTAAFSEEQVRRLLDRAVELQALEPVEPGSLTIGGVEQLAAEVGIPPEHVRQAALELRSERPGTLARVPHGVLAESEGRRMQLADSRGRLAEGKWDRVVVSRTLEGEIPESAFPSLVEEIQERLGIVGHASVLAGSLTWSPATQSEDSRRLVITVRPRDGVTQVRVQEEFGLGGIRKLALPAGVFAGAGVGAVLSALLGLGAAFVVPGAIVGVPLAIRALIRIESNTRRPQLEELAERLRRMGEEALGERGA